MSAQPNGGDFRDTVKTVAANRYSSPCSLTNVIINSAIAPVAAEIKAGRPPTKAVITAIQKEAYSPTFGSLPESVKNATNVPDNMSALILENHSRYKTFVFKSSSASVESRTHETTRQKIYLRDLFKAWP
ncbi:MAG: hypothetical protein KME57_35250 [Scytonema hyalinum WJT4-NPBG1]|nr:hypothetical protein [Scytonema hyalinum WJT4-NPBG1]